MTGAALVDNHLIGGPIFTAYGVDGYAPLPEWIWDLVGRVREATLEAATRAKPSTSHIFTNYLSNRPSEGQAVQELRAMAAERQVRFVPVWLTCPRKSWYDEWDWQSGGSGGRCLTPTASGDCCTPRVCFPRRRMRSSSTRRPCPHAKPPNRSSTTPPCDSPARAAERVNAED